MISLILIIFFTIFSFTTEKYHVFAKVNEQKKMNAYFSVNEANKSSIDQHMDSTSQKTFSEQSLTTIVSDSNKSKQKLFSKQSSLPLLVILQNEFLDGIVTETVVTEPDLLNEFADWKLVDIRIEQMILKNDIDVFVNSYLGVTDDHILTLFQGKPNEGNIIQSFFQLDMGKLESRTIEHLKCGIPIHSKQQYEEVLASFKPFILSNGGKSAVHNQALD